MDRNEAIEIVREYYYPSSGKDLNEALETLVPELKESEDERIRKSIIKSITDLRAECFEIYGVKKENIIAWLEKQGEQNPKSADFIPTDCTSDAKYENRWHKVEDSLPDNNREVLCKDAIGNFFIGRYYNDGDYWEVSMYDEPDKSNKDNPPVIMWANIPSCEQNLANSAKTCKVERNSTWSEEDIKTIERIVCILDGIRHYNTVDNKQEKPYQSEIDFLKSFKERVQPRQNLHPRYIEGKGIYVPIIDVVLNMQDEPQEMTWDEAKDIALSKEQTFVVLYYKDEINALLEKHGGQKLEGWHWTSTQSSGATYACYVYFLNSYVGYYTTRTNGYSVRAFSAYHPES